jgi:hypothetical protein
MPSCTGARLRRSPTHRRSRRGVGGNGRLTVHGYRSRRTNSGDIATGQIKCLPGRRIGSGVTAPEPDRMPARERRIGSDASARVPDWFRRDPARPDRIVCSSADWFRRNRARPDQMPTPWCRIGFNGTAPGLIRMPAAGRRIGPSRDRVPRHQMSAMTLDTRRAAAKVCMAQANARPPSGPERPRTCLALC